PPRFRSATQQHAITQRHQVEPSATPRTFSDRPAFITGWPQPIAVRTQQLSGKGAATHPGAIGLRNTVHLADLSGCYPESGADTRGGGIGGRDKGIGSVIHIEQTALRPLG